MLLGVLIAWLLHDMPISDDEKALVEHSVQVTWQGDVSPEQIRVFQRQAEDAAVRDYIKKKPNEFNAFMFFQMVFWATFFGMLAAYSLLFDFKTLGLMKRQRARALDASKL
jgi:hypothetical protein